MAEAVEDHMARSGKRRPQPDDIPLILHKIAEGDSLRAVCEAMGIDTPSAHRMIHDDPAPGGWRQQYARACEVRADILAEQGQQVALAAALKKTYEGNTVDPSGARVYLEAVKWNTARMAPKKAPEQRVRILREMTDEELDAELAELEDDDGDDAQP